MFDIAQFSKLRLRKQIYDSTLSRSSMIRISCSRISVEIRCMVKVGLARLDIGLRKCGLVFETLQLHLINFFEWNMRKTFVFVLNVWRVNKCIWNVQINVHYSQSMYWIVENSTMFFLIKGLLFWLNPLSKQNTTYEVLPVLKKSTGHRIGIEIIFGVIWRKLQPVKFHDNF